MERYRRSFETKSSEETEIRERPLAFPFASHSSPSRFSVSRPFREQIDELGVMSTSMGSE